MDPRSLENEAEDRMAEWLSQVDWTYIVHWTFKKTRSPKAASGIIRTHLEEALDPEMAFWKLEEGKVGGREHIHGLIRFSSNRSTTPREVRRVWSRKYGTAEVEEYNQGEGGAHYVGEYLRGPVDEYDVYHSGEVG